MTELVIDRIGFLKNGFIWSYTIAFDGTKLM